MSSDTVGQEPTWSSATKSSPQHTVHRQDHHHSQVANRSPDHTEHRDMGHEDRRALSPQHHNGDSHYDSDGQHEQHSQHHQHHHHHHHHHQPATPPAMPPSNHVIVKRERDIESPHRAVSVSAIMHSSGQPHPHHPHHHPGVSVQPALGFHTSGSLLGTEDVEMYLANLERPHATSVPVSGGSPAPAAVPSPNASHPTLATLTNTPVSMSSAGHPDHSTGSPVHMASGGVFQSQVINMPPGTYHLSPESHQQPPGAPDQGSGSPSAYMNHHLYAGSPVVSRSGVISPTPQTYYSIPPPSTVSSQVQSGAIMWTVPSEATAGSYGATPPSLAALSPRYPGYPATLDASRSDPALGYSGSPLTPRPNGMAGYPYPSSGDLTQWSSLTSSLLGGQEPRRNSVPGMPGKDRSLSHTTSRNSIWVCSLYVPDR